MLVKAGSVLGFIAISHLSVNSPNPAGSSLAVLVNSPRFSGQLTLFVPCTVCSVGSVGDAGRLRPAAPGGGALLCGGGDGGGHPELGQVRPQPVGSGEHCGREGEGGALLLPKPRRTSTSSVLS